MEKELPNKFRFTVEICNTYYLAELSTQADAYNLSATDSEGKDICNLNHKVLKERAEEYVNSGYWKIIEEPFQLPSKFTFKSGRLIYTGIEQEDKSYTIYWKNYNGGFDKYNYTRESVEDHVKAGDWIIEKEVDMSVIPSEVVSVLIPASEPTLLDVIKEFVETTKSEVTILPHSKWNVSCPFLSDDVVVDTEDELKQLLAATSSIIKMAVGKMANGNKK